jgi:hypothetical protein
MTLLVSWTGVDTHGTASVYMAADSRITWSKEIQFDYGRKVFGFANHPDILGYCGDVLFPSIVLGQITEMAEAGLLFGDGSSCKEKFEAIKEKLVQIFEKYPRDVEQITRESLQVIHASREPQDNSKFSCHMIEWRRRKEWTGKELALPNQSGLLCVLVVCFKNFDRCSSMTYIGAGGTTYGPQIHC